MKPNNSFFLRSGCVALAWLALGGAWSFAAAAELNKSARARLTDAFFADTNVPHFFIEVKGTNLTAIRKDPRRSVRATVRVGDEVFEDVAIHCKGAAGSFRNFDDRPALTLNLDKFIENRHFRGLDKFHLNNSVQDPSYLSEALCGELAIASGVPAARGAHARVTLNGRDLGFYGLKEGFNKPFLARFFQKTKGNLYDGGFVREITDDLELDSGEGTVPKRADLKALAAAAQTPDAAARWGALQKTLDVERFAGLIAVEVMTWHWDGYCLNRNNYRVYHNPADGRMVFFPHGMDQMFWDPNGPLLPQFQGLVARSFVQTPEGRRMYRERVGTLLTNVFTAEKITNFIARMQARIQPALLAMNKDAARNQASAARNLQNQALARIARLAQVLDEPEPEPLKFGADGYAKLPPWRVQDTQGTAKLGAQKVDEKETLHIAVGADRRSVASWRCRLLLPPGRYVFEARAKTKGVKLLANDSDAKGVGAGIRLSMAPGMRKNNLMGDTDWRKLEYEFDVPAGPDEVVLVAELRASGGEAWFEKDSLRLRKK